MTLHVVNAGSHLHCIVNVFERQLQCIDAPWGGLGGVRLLNFLVGVGEQFNLAAS